MFSTYPVLYHPLHPTRHACICTPRNLRLCGSVSFGDATGGHAMGKVDMYGNISSIAAPSQREGIAQCTHAPCSFLFCFDSSAAHPHSFVRFDSVVDAHRLDIHVIRSFVQHHGLDNLRFPPCTCGGGGPISHATNIFQITEGPRGERLPSAGDATAGTAFPVVVGDVGDGGTAGRPQHGASTCAGEAVHHIRAATSTWDRRGEDARRRGAGAPRRFARVRGRIQTLRVSARRAAGGGG